jgi:hypothetical protein
LCAQQHAAEASVTASGSKRARSAVRNQPLKSNPRTSLGASGGSQRSCTRRRPGPPPKKVAQSGAAHRLPDSAQRRPTPLRCRARILLRNFLGRPGLGSWLAALPIHLGPFICHPSGRSRCHSSVRLKKRTPYFFAGWTMSIPLPDGSDKFAIAPPSGLRWISRSSLPPAARARVTTASMSSTWKSKCIGVQ